MRHHAYGRTLQRRAMPDTFTVSTPGEVTNTGDGTWSAGASTVSAVGRWKFLNGSEQIVAGGIAGVGDVLVELVAFTAVADGATLTVAARGDEPEHTFAVKQVLPRSDEWTTQVLCTEG